MAQGAVVGRAAHRLHSTAGYRPSDCVFGAIDASVAPPTLPPLLLTRSLVFDPCWLTFPLQIRPAAELWTRDIDVHTFSPGLDLPPPLLVSGHSPQYPTVFLRVVHPSVLSCVSVSSHTRVRPGVAVGTSAHIRYLYLPPLLGQRRDDDPPAPRVGCASDTIRATNKDPRRGAADLGLKQRRSPFGRRRCAPCTSAGASRKRTRRRGVLPILRGGRHASALVDHDVDHGEHGGRQYPPPVAIEAGRAGKAASSVVEIGARPTTFLQGPLLANWRTSGQPEVADGVAEAKGPSNRPYVDAGEHGRRP